MQVFIKSPLQYDYAEKLVRKYVLTDVKLILPRLLSFLLRIRKERIENYLIVKTITGREGPMNK